MWAAVLGCAVLISAAVVIPAAIAILISYCYMDD